MGSWLEVWRRPGHASFGRVIDDPPFRSATIHDSVTRVGDGTMDLPNTFDRFDDILFIDRNTPANSESSLIRVFSDQSSAGEVVFEWIPNLLTPTSAKGDPFVDVGGKGIKSILGYARTEAWDWDGTDFWAPNVPDWIYGGANKLGNPGFEDGAITPTSYVLQITATGGTYTLSDGTDTTAAIAWDALSGVIDTRLETDITAITDVVVDSSVGVRFITFVTPPFGVTLTVNTGSLTGGTATLTADPIGGVGWGPWTIADTLARGQPIGIGSFTTFQITSAQAHSGTYSLQMDPSTSTALSNRNAGAQQVVSVIGGQVYQASIWIRPTNGTNTYFFGIYGIGEEIVVRTGPTAYTANVWTQITLPNVAIPENVNQIIFRIQNADGGPFNPATFYVDDAAFYEGLAATTVGGILSDLYADATANHPGRVVWEDEANPGTPYLTLDFDAALDSNGNAWLHAELSARIWLRQSFLQVIEHFESNYGYEFRVVPDDIEAGTWLLQGYNPGGMGTDYTAAASPAIQGGAADVNRQIRRFLPATQFLVEGLGRTTARDEDIDLTAALGRIETSRLTREAGDEDSLTVIVAEDTTDAFTGTEPWSYELVNPADQPMTAYGLGDVLTVHDPPEVDGPGRVWDIVATFSPDEGEHWEVELLPEGT